MALPTLLVADDDPMLRQVYTMKLSKAGFAVFAAADGGELCRLIADHPPALILCDIHMVPIDGFEVLKRFPRDKRHFPIVMLSNFQDGATQQKALNLGADGYLVKKDLTLAGLVAKAKELLKS